MIKVDRTALVDKGAELGDGVEVGPYSLVEKGTKVGKGTRIASHCLIASGTEIGEKCSIHHGAVLGTIPQDLKFRGEETRLRMGKGNIVREYATLNRGTIQRGETRVGDNNLFMAYSHVAHDCLIGDNVVIANAVNLGGHVEIGDYTILGGMVPVHQFVKIGPHVMVGGGFRVSKDICPFVTVAGYPLKVVGLNLIGLRRRGFPSPTISILKKVYQILFRSRFNVSQALKVIQEEVEPIPEVRTITDFIEESKRGIILG